MLEVLRSSESNMVENFEKLAGDLDVHLQIAKSNINYLRIFHEINSKFWKTVHLNDLLSIIRQYPIYFRLIWLKNGYFSTKARITLLFRIFANQLILKCCKDYLNNFDLLFTPISDINNKISNLENCIRCFQEYFLIYIKVSI